MLRSFLPGFIGLMGLACASARANDAMPSFLADSPEAREAAMVLQGTTAEDFIADSAIRLVASALNAIRGKYPEVRNVREPLVPELEPRLESAMVKGLCTPRSPEKLPEPVQDTVETTGLSAVDSLNRWLGADRVHVQVCFGRWIVVFPVFTRHPNVPAIARRFAPLEGVIRAGAPMYLSVGGRDDVRMTVENSTLRFVFVQRVDACCGQRSDEFRYWPDNGRLEKL